MSRRGPGLGDADPEIEELLGLGAAKHRKARAAKKPEVDVEPERARRLNPGRFLLVCGTFIVIMAACLIRFADMAAQNVGADEPAVAAGFVNAEAAAALAKKDDVKPIRATRAAIVDRNGAPLARDVATYELYLDRKAFAYPEELREAAETLAGAFPNRFKAPALYRDLKKRRTTLLARPLTAAEAQRAHDLGIPGLYLTPRYDRYYPAGAVAAHAVGFVNVDGRGKAGVEAALDRRMTQTPEEAVRLSLDLRVQRAARSVLAAKVRGMSAKAASAVVMSVETGEVLALVSLPDYNPHRLPPQPKSKAEHEQSPLYHRAAAGGYELGSVMKIVAYATALEEGAASMAEAFDPLPTLIYGDHEIAWDGGPASVSLPAAFARSLNRVAAELALRAGRGAQARMFDALGLTRESPVEVGETKLGAPEKKRVWRPVDTAVASYGYGIEVSPLHLAAAVASLVNGGESVTPTLLSREPGAASGERQRVVSAETSRRVRELLRLAVTDGTGVLADVPGLAIGGKTGTARMHGPQGYDKSRIRASFAAIAPSDRPKVAVIVTLDEPTAIIDGEPKRSAKYTAAPVAGAVIEAIAPLVGVSPRPVTERARLEGLQTERRPAWARGATPAEAMEQAATVTMGGVY